MHVNYSFPITFRELYGLTVKSSTSCSVGKKETSRSIEEELKHRTTEGWVEGERIFGEEHLVMLLLDLQALFLRLVVLQAVVLAVAGCYRRSATGLEGCSSEEEDGVGRLAAWLRRTSVTSTTTTSPDCTSLPTLRSCVNYFLPFFPTFWE